jgi:DNA replicative helicase MCM subunit Mcm2 (Cdc46/Mcm family)
VTTESLVQWDQIVSLKRSHLDTLVSERLSLKAQIAELNGKVAQVDSKIAANFMKSEVKTVGIGEVRVTLVVPEKPAQRFDKVKAMRRLLELGVEEKKVARAWKDATTEGEVGSPYVKVTVPGEKE